MLFYGIAGYSSGDELPLKSFFKSINLNERLDSALPKRIRRFPTLYWGDPLSESLIRDNTPFFVSIGIML